MCHNVAAQDLLNDSFYIYGVLENSHLFLMVTAGAELVSGTVCCCLGSWSKRQINKESHFLLRDDRMLKKWRAKGTCTFIFTLAQAGKLSLQPLWTEALQSGKRKGLVTIMSNDDGGCGCVKGIWKGWGIESLTGISELARKLHQPANESQTGAAHVMQSRSNTVHEGGRGKKMVWPITYTHAVQSELHGKCSIM